MAANFKFGDRVMVSGRSSSRIIVEVLNRGKRVRIIDLVELTAEQRAEWTKPAEPGTLKFIPGMVVDSSMCMLWDEYMAALELSLFKQEQKAKIK